MFHVDVQDDLQSFIKGAAYNITSGNSGHHNLGLNDKSNICAK